MSNRDTSSGTPFWEGTDDTEARERYLTLVNTIDDGIFQLDGEGRFVAVNDTIVETTGYAREELLGEHVSTILGAAALSRIDRELERLHTDTDERSESLDLRVETATGIERRWDLRLNPVGEDRAAIGVARDVTDRPRQERERELEQYEQLVETIDDGVYVLDETGTIQLVNEAFAEMLGYTPAELVGSDGADIVDEETADEGGDIYAGPDDEPKTIEARLRTADAEWLPVETTLTMFPGDDSDWHRGGVVRDITERKERERTIEESRRRYRTLVENFPNGAVGLFDDDLRYTAVGGQLFNELNFDPDDRIGRSIREIHPDELVEKVKPYFRAALDGEVTSFEIEYQGQHLDAIALPIEPANGEIESGMIVIQDVTERREAQRELRESEVKFRMLAENLGEIVWMATEDAEEFIYLNPAFEEVWGMDRQQLYDDPLSFLDAIHPDDREDIRKAFTALPEQEFDEEYRVVRPDGEVRWVHSRGTSVHDEDEEMTRVIGIGEDVTERKERERKLEESERRYRTLAENFPNGAVGVYDHDLRYTLTQGAVLGESLPSRNQLEGRTVSAVFPPDITEDLEPLLRTAVEEGETGSATFEFRGQHWRVWATPLRDVDGDIFAGLSFAQDITEPVEREAELERALDLLSKTERIADVGGWEIDVETKDVFWTDQIFELLEVDGDEEPPLDEALDMYHEADQQDVVDAVERGIESGEPFEVEARNRTGSGDIRWLQIQGVPEVEDGEVVSLRGAALDITDRREREQFLREMQGIAADSDRTFEEKLQAMFALGCERFDMELGGLASVDPVTDYYEVEAVSGDHEYFRPGEQYPLSETYCHEVSPDQDTRAITDPEGFEDKMCYEHFGLQSYLGTYLELDGAADRSFWFASSDPKGDGFSETARRYHHQMGQWIRYELERQHHTDQLAAINRLNAVARDINRELAQQSTRESIESVVCDRLADSESYEFAWIGTVDEERQEIVPSTTATTQGQLEDGSGVDDGERDDQAPTETALRTGQIQVLRDSDQAAEFEPWLRQTQEWEFASLAAIPIAYEEQHYGVLTVYSDRPNAFDGEERAVISQLGEIVGLAIAAVEREQKLEYERERLEFVNRLLRHNLLNGLNAISAQASVLDGHVGSDGDRYLETIHERVDDMADLIETMRSLMTIITDEQHDLEPVDLESVLRGELRKARTIHRDAKFELHGDLDDADDVQANEALTEVFENLLVNAVQHNHADTPEVTITVENDDDSVTVRVADNGPGVPDELKDRIFEKGEKNFDSPGTGFGLYLAREIIEGCDGSITVANNDPTGAVFSITLHKA